MSEIKDRVTEFRRVRASELQDNDGNWRTHQMFQRDALAGILHSVGIADALKAYYSERQGGLTLLDGHLRKEDFPDVEWPVLILDINDDEADLLLSVFDPIAALAGMDKEKALALTEYVVTDDLAVRELLMRLRDEALALEDEDAAGDEEKKSKEGPPEMALQPFEHYDYILLMFKTTFDFERALDVLGIEKETFTARTSKNYEKGKRRTGLGRVLNGAVVLDMICNQES